MNPRRWSVAVSLLALALVGCGPDAVLDIDDLADGAVAPPADAVLADAGAAEAAAWIRQEIDGSGRPVVVKFFASWCGPCVDEMPVLLAAAASHPEVAFLGIDHQDRRPNAEAFVAEHGLEVIPTLFDIEGETAFALRARGMPSVSFVDTDGRLLHTHTGPMDSDLLDEWIGHLAGAGPRPADRPDAPSTDQP